jgi:hypothetical protein
MAAGKPGNGLGIAVDESLAGLATVTYSRWGRSSPLRLAKAKDRNCAGWKLEAEGR